MEHWVRTSLDKLRSFVHQLLHHFVIADELLKAEEMQEPRSDFEKCQDAKDNDGDRKVNVEAIRDERYDVHVAHELKGKKRKNSKEFIRPQLI